MRHRTRRLETLQQPLQYCGGFRRARSGILAFKDRTHEIAVRSGLREELPAFKYPRIEDRRQVDKFQFLRCPPAREVKQSRCCPSSVVVMKRLGGENGQ